MPEGRWERERKASVRNVIKRRLVLLSVGAVRGQGKDESKVEDDPKGKEESFSLESDLDYSSDDNLTGQAAHKEEDPGHALEETPPSGGGAGSTTSTGKNRRRRTAFTSEQLLELEKEFHCKKYKFLLVRNSKPSLASFSIGPLTPPALSIAGGGKLAGMYASLWGWGIS